MYWLIEPFQYSRAVKETMHVVEFNRIDLASIESGLEHTLAQIKAGAFPDAQACVLVIGRCDGATHVRAYGKRASPLEIDGWLGRALFGY